MPDCTRAACDEDGAPGDRPVGEETAVRSQGGNAEARTELIRGFRREWDRLLRRQDSPLRGRSPLPAPSREIHPNAFADSSVVNAGTDGLDDADAVLIWHLERELRVPTCSRLPVRRIDAGEAQAHKNLSYARLRLRNLIDCEHLVRGAAALVEGRDQPSSAR
jgi:hypothetical protein